MNKKAPKAPGSRLPNDVDRVVGKKVRTLRLEAGLTLQQLASSLGISHQQLQKYETGTNRVSAGMLPGLADALSVEVTEFFKDETESTENESPEDHLRRECQTWLGRVRSEESLSNILRILKAFAR